MDIGTDLIFDKVKEQNGYIPFTSTQWAHSQGMKYIRKLNKKGFDYVEANALLELIEQEFESQGFHYGFIAGIQAATNRPPIIRED